MRADRMDALLEATQRDLYWLPAHVQRLEEGALLVLHDGGADLLHNQVVTTPVGAAGDLDALVARVQGLHPRGSRWRVAPTGPMAALQRALPRAGYAPGFQGDAFSVDTATQWSEADVRVERVVDARGMRDNLDVAGEGFGRPIRPDVVSDQLAMCAAPDAPTARFVAYGPEGQPIGVANLNLHRALGVGFLWSGTTLPGWRGRGVYRALLGARCRWAASQGLRRVGVYANRHTSGPVVARLGFDRHGPLELWDRVGPPTDGQS